MLRLREDAELAGLRPEDDASTVAALLATHTSARFGRRCLAAYHKVRLERICDMAWERGCSGMLPEAVDKNLRRLSGNFTGNISMQYRRM